MEGSNSQFVRSPGSSKGGEKDLPSFPAKGGPTDIKKMTLRELQEALERERHLLQSRSALLSKLPDKGARIKEKIRQMEEEEKDRVEKKTSEEELRRRSDVLQRVEFAVRCLSSDSTRRLAEVVRSTLEEETLPVSLESDEEDEDTIRRRREEEEEEEGVANVLKMLATSQISQSRGKQRLVEEQVPLFARKCAERMDLQQAGKQRFVPNKVKTRTKTKVEEEDDKQKKEEDKQKKEEDKRQGVGPKGEWDESLKTPDWVFNQTKTIKMDESFHLIANLSNTVKGVADKQGEGAKKGVSISDGGGGLMMMGAAASAYRFHNEISEEDYEDTIPEETDEDAFLECENTEEGGLSETLSDLISSTLTLQ